MGLSYTCFPNGGQKGLDCPKGRQTQRQEYQILGFSVEKENVRRYKQGIGSQGNLGSVCDGRGSHPGRVLVQTAFLYVAQ